jgi:hypothetical protein
LKPIFQAAIGAVVLLLFSWCMSVYLHLPLTDNEGIFTCVGQALANGALLYRDIWDHKPPLLFTHFWLLSRIGGDPGLSLHLYAIFIHALNAVLLFFLAKKWLGSANWLSPLFYLVLALPPYFQSWTPQPELLMQPFLLAGWLLVQKKGHYRWLLAGILSACGFFTKQSFLIYLPLFFMENPFWGASEALWFFAGMDLTAMVVVLPFFTSGRMDDLWYATWGFNHFYLQNGWDHFFQHPEFREGVLRWYRRISGAYGITFAIAFGFLVKCIYQSFSKKTEGTGSLALWFFLSMLSTAISGYFFTYYSIVLLPPLSIILARVLVKFHRTHAREAYVLGFLLLMGPLVSWATFTDMKADDLMWSNYPTDRNSAAKEMGLYLKTIAKPGDTLLAWSMEPQLYAYSVLQMYAGLKTPLIDHLFIIPGETERLKETFDKAPPRLLIISDYAPIAPPPDFIGKEPDKKWAPTYQIGKLRLFTHI